MIEGFADMRRTCHESIEAQRTDPAITTALEVAHMTTQVMCCDFYTLIVTVERMKLTHHATLTCSAPSVALVMPAKKKALKARHGFR